MTDPTLANAVGPWHEFYSLLGTASATLVGLLFVAASIASAAFSDGNRAASRVFLSASVIHFSTILIACLTVIAPGHTWLSLGGMIGVCGVFGLAYYGLTWRDMMRDGLMRRIDLEDRVWYAILPAVGYLAECAAGVTLAMSHDAGVVPLALSMGFLLVVGLHNAWDITIWAVNRTRS